MKTNVRIKTLLVGISFLLAGLSSYAQFNCNNPKPIVNMPVALFTQYLPPVAGVNYGCSSQSNYSYYSFLVCGSGSMNFELSSNTGGDLDLIMYGPFATPTNNCSQLTAPNIIACGATTVSPLNVPVASVTAGNYYVLVVHSGNSSPLLDFTGTAVVDSSCLPAQCVAGLIDHICLVSVDSATQKYKITWPETPGIATASFNILKLDNFGAYQQITNSPVGNLSEYIDMASNPAIHTESYKIERVDSCLYTYGSGPANIPIHLNTSINQLNQVALSWNAYVCPVNPAINYIIFRGSSPGLEMPIDTVPSIVNAYMDLTPPPGTNYYKVAATVSFNCIPSRAPTNMSFSNNAMVSVLSIGDQQLESGMIQMYPNPASENLNITVAGHTLYEIEIWDAAGRMTTSAKNLENNSHTINVSETAAGYYIVHIKTTDGKFARVPFIKN